MARSAFARARGFLNYHRTGKWFALLAGAGSGCVYLALLVILALFIDLVVHRGEIPCYAQLPAREKFLFVDSLSRPGVNTYLDPQKILQTSQGVTDPIVLQLISTKTENSLPPREQALRRELLWFLHLPVLLEDAVEPRAAAVVGQDLADRISRLGLETALNRNLSGHGILGLAVRNYDGVVGKGVAFLARWNSWTWYYGNTVYLAGLLVAALILALLRAGLIFLSQYLAAQATLEAVTRLRRAMYHHTYRLGALAFRSLGPTEAVAVSTRHLEAVHQGLFLWLTSAFREPLKFVLLLIFAMLVHFWLALAFLLLAFLVWVIGGQVVIYFRREGHEEAQRAADQLTLLQESFMLMRLVKVYLMELFNQARVERQLSRFAKSHLRRYRSEAIYRPLFFLLGLMAALVLLFAIGWVVLHDQVGLVNIVTVIIALVSLYWPVAVWLNLGKVMRDARHSADILFEFLERTGSVSQAMEAESLLPLKKDLVFDRVSLNEPGTGRPLLQGVNLTIQAGQKVALVGPDDNEKYALLYLIPRFVDPESGEIRIDDRNLRWVKLDSLRKQIAMVMQHNLVFNDTVVHNIGCGDSTYPLPRIIEAAKLVHAHQFIKKLPQGYGTVIGEMGYPLKTSEKFRIALARALLRDPSILIIEEPFTPPDEDTRALVDDTLARILPGRTVIFLPHRLITIRQCNQVFLLYNGRIEASGVHRELVNNHELYRHLHYLEFNEYAGLAAGVPATIQEESEL